MVALEDGSVARVPSSSAGESSRGSVCPERVHSEPLSPGRAWEFLREAWLAGLNRVPPPPHSTPHAQAAPHPHQPNYYYHATPPTMQHAAPRPYYNHAAPAPAPAGGPAPQAERQASAEGAAEGAEWPEGRAESSSPSEACAGPVAGDSGAAPAPDAAAAAAAAAAASVAPLLFCFELL